MAANMAMRPLLSSRLRISSVYWFRPAGQPLLWPQQPLQPQTQALLGGVMPCKLPNRPKHCLSIRPAAKVVHEQHLHAATAADTMLEQEIRTRDTFNAEMKQEGSPSELNY